VLSLLVLAILPLRAESLTDASSTTTAHDIQPYSYTFSFLSSSPVNIQTEGFSLTADSGSLIHDLDIRMAFIPNKGGTPLPSNMENVTGICEGVSLLPNGVHFSESNPASITLSYNPARIPMGYKPNEIYTYYCDDAQH
jgi:hypothetical protein